MYIQLARMNLPGDMSTDVYLIILFTQFFFVFLGSATPLVDVIVLLGILFPSIINALK